MKQLNDFRLTLPGFELVPIVIGGMGVDISTAGLALEAARLGGVGHISDAMLTFVSDRKFGTRFTAKKAAQFSASKNSPDKSSIRFDLDAVYEAQIRHVRSVMERKRGPGAVFINVMEKLTMADPVPTLTARLRAALDGGIDGITLSAGLHMQSFKLIEDHPRFRDAKLGIIVSSARALKIFLRSAAKSDRMPDYIVVEGPLAGGHLGFGEDWQSFRLSDIVTDVLAELAKNELEIPVIPAGGVFTGSDAVALLEAGASAVQVATRFTVTNECGLPSSVKQRYFEASEDDVVVSSVSPTGYPLRLLKSSPCFNSNVRPSCEAFGFVLKDGSCPYVEAYHRTAVDEKGNRMPVSEKICLCHHFSKYQCYTCGHYAYRLKDTSVRGTDGRYITPSAEHVFRDYQFSTGQRIMLPVSESHAEVRAA